LHHDLSASKPEHRFSLPARQNLHVPQAEKIQATPTLSPVLKSVGFAADSFDSSDHLMPSTIGNRGGGVPTLNFIQLGMTNPAG